MKAFVAVLVIVLGVVPSAADEFYFDGPAEVILGESVEIEITADAPFPYIRYLLFDAGLNIAISGPGFGDVCVPPPPLGCPCGCMGFGEYCLCELSCLWIPPNPPPDPHWICKLSSTGADLGTVYRLDLLSEDLGTVLDSHTVTVVPAPPTLTVVAPNGAEELVAGSTYRIEWTDSRAEANCPADYSLELSTDNGQSWIYETTAMDANGTQDVFSYDWLVPSTDSNQCLIRIADADDVELSDTSDAAFTIYQCTLAYDLNHDCLVNFLDLALLASEWLKCDNPFDPQCL